MSTDLLHRAPRDEALNEQAREAVKQFRSLQPTLSAYARAMTGRANVRVVMAAKDNGSTDGSTIYYRPPIALGESRKHDRSLCNKRDKITDLMLCSACAAREEVLVTIYHEIAHICHDSFAHVTDADKKRAIDWAIKESRGAYREKIEARIKAAPSWKTRDYINLMSLINEYLPTILNALEDARVNRELFKGKPGIQRMFDADTKRLFEEGVEHVAPDGSIKMGLWSEAPLNSQAIIGVFCMASGYTSYEDWLHPKVAEAMRDQQLNEIVGRMAGVMTASGVYNLSFHVLQRLRELGFCGTPQDPDPEPEPPEEEEQDEQQEESDSSQSDDESLDSDGDADNSGSEADEEAGDQEDDSSSEGSSGDDGSSSDSDAEEGELSDEGESPNDRGDGDEAGSDSEGSEADGDADQSPEQGAGEEGESDSSEGESGTDDSSPSGDASGGLNDEADDQSDCSTESSDVSSSSGSSEDPSLDEAEPSDGDSEDSAEGSDSDGDEAQGGDVHGDGDPADSSSEAGGDQVEDLSDPSVQSDPSDPSGEGSDDDSSEFPLPLDDDADTGADDGYGGTDLLGDPEPAPPMGQPEDADPIVKMFGDHDEKPKSAEAKVAEDAVDMAIIQGIYFTTPSATVWGVREHVFDHPLMIDGKDYSRAWSAYRGGHKFDAEAYEVEQSVLSPAISKLRRAFTDNQRGSRLTGLKGGKINTRALGSRAPFGDPRLFRKDILPGRKDYYVLVGMDVSGSTNGRNLALEKRAVMAQCEMLARVGVEFEVFAHTGDDHIMRSSGWGWGDSGWDLDIYHIKSVKEPWTDAVRERLLQINAANVNLDGHALEFFRKRAEKSTATDKVILYYSDGKFPAANKDEELQVFQREMRTCERLGITLMGVGIRTDSPREHGLDTVEVHTDDDLVKVVDQLERRLSVGIRR